MKHLITPAVLLLSLAACAADVGRVIVRQQWPWSTAIKVEFELSDVTDPVDVKLQAFNGSSEYDAEAVAAATQGARYGLTQGGTYTLTIDPARLVMSGTGTIPDFQVRVSVSESSASMTEKLYRIIDLTTFKVEDVRRADFYNGKYTGFVTDYKAIDPSFYTSLTNVFIWTGVTNEPSYKTTKLVLRRIPAKGEVFETASNPSWNQQVDVGYAPVTLTNDYWMSVFEVTEKQYRLLTAVNGTEGSYPAASAETEAMPAGLITHQLLRGKASEWTGFPENIYAVSASSDLLKMRNNLPDFIVDLPTEAQWEFACRAGTTCPLYNGVFTSNHAQYLADLSKIGWAGTGGVRHAGGLLLPNAFGLYDMVGNMYEQCRDLATEKSPAVTEGARTEPIGSTDTAAACNIGRGGSYSKDPNYCNAFYRSNNDTVNAQNDCRGFRLWIRD